MPPLTRWFIRISFVYLGIALAYGVLLAGQTLWDFRFPIALLFPGYIHLITVGWLTLLIFGVANWMFPRYSQAQPHGHTWLNWTAFALLNLGLLLRLVAEPLDSLSPHAFWSWSLVLSALMLELGGMAFIITLWQRVKVK